MQSLGKDRKENHVLAAYRAMLTQPLDAEQLEVTYRELFRSVSDLKPVRRETFERFTIVDPNIRTVIQSNTTI